MEDVDIVLSLQKLNKDLKGLQARVSLMESTEKLIFLQRLGKKTEERDIQELIRQNTDIRLRENFYNVIETLLECTETVAVGTQLVLEMERRGMELDMSSSYTLSYGVLHLLTNLLVLLSLIRSTRYLKLMLKVYKRLDRDREEELQELERFLEKYNKPVPALVTELSGARSMLTPCVLSCGKLIQKLGRQPTFLLENLMQSPVQLVHTDSLQEGFSVPETTVGQELVRVAFFAFILIDMPWKISPENDPGYLLLQSLLEENLATALFRNNFSTLHGTLHDLVKSRHDKEKSKKLSQLKQWEEKANSSMKEVHRDRRAKLSLTMQDYLYIFEDFPALIGPKFILIIIMMSQAVSEIKWWSVHFSFLQMRRERLEPDPELSNLIRLYSRYKKLVRQNISSIYNHMIRSLDLENIGEMFARTDLSSEHQLIVEEVLDELENLQGGERPSVLLVNQCADLLQILAIRFNQSSSICKKSFHLSAYVEMISALGKISIDGLDEGFPEVNLSFFYPIRKSLEELFQAQISPSDLSSFPRVCEDFTRILTEKCPEEHKEILNESFKLCEQFLESIAGRCIDKIDKLIRLQIRLHESTRADRAASKLHARINKKKTKDTDEDVEDDIAKKEKSTGQAGRKERDRARKLEKNNRKAGIVLDESCIEDMVVLRKEIVEIAESLEFPDFVVVGSRRMNPAGFFAHKLKHYFRTFLVENIKFPRLPSTILESFAVLVNCMENNIFGLDATNLYNEMMSGLRDDDTIVLSIYVKKYTDAVLKELSVPGCHYNMMRNSFCQLDNNGEITDTIIMYLTDTSELDGLLELTGVGGVLQLVEEIQLNISEELHAVFSLIEEGNKSQPNTLIIQPLIKIGKLLTFLQLLQGGMEEVSRRRNGFLQDVCKAVLSSSPEHIPVPEELLVIGETLGIQQVAVQLSLDRWTRERGDLEVDRKLLIHAFTNLIPVLSRLLSSRFLWTSNSGRNQILSHQNGIEFLAQCVSLVVGPLAIEETPAIQNVVFGITEHFLPSWLSIIVLINSFFNMQGMYVDCLARSPNCTLSMKKNHTDNNTLQNEVSSRRIAKFVKDFQKIIDL